MSSQVDDRTIFGFWLYLLSDFMMFGALFATYLVLRNSTFGGPGPQELFHLPFTYAQTLLFLGTGYASGLGGFFASRGNRRAVFGCFGLTFVLGAIFLAMALTEMTHLTLEGYSWKRSAFLSGFFTLVGTHAIHVVIALLWTILLLIPKLDATSVQRLTCLRMFWQFLNVIWVFIFAIVYLLGVK